MSTPSTESERQLAKEALPDKPVSKGEAQKSPNRLEAWSKVLGTHCIYISTWGLINAYGAYVPYYVSDLLPSYSASAIAWPGTLQAVLIISVGVFTGPLFDRGYIRSLMVLGSFLVVFGMMMLSLAREYYQVILAQGVCVGIGCGMVYVPCLALVSSAFAAKDRALAIGLATCGAAVGGVVYPIALQHLLPLVGFGWATRILGFMALVTLTVGVALNLWRSHRRDSGANAAAAPAVATKPKAPPRQLLDMDALRDPAFLLFGLALFFIFLAYYVPFFYVPAYAEASFRATDAQGVYLLAVMNAATFPSRIVASWLAQKFGSLQTLLATTVGCAIVLYAWFGVTNLSGLWAWVVFWGLTAGPQVTVPAAVVPALSPNPATIGTRMGMAFLCAAMGGLVGSPVAGVLIHNGYVGMKALIGTAMALGAILILVVGIVVRAKQGKRNNAS